MKDVARAGEHAVAIYHSGHRADSAEVGKANPVAAAKFLQSL